MPLHLIFLVFALVLFIVAAILDSPWPPSTGHPGGHLFGWLGGAFLAASFMV